MTPSSPPQSRKADPPSTGSEETGGSDSDNNNDNNDSDSDSDADSAGAAGSSEESSSSSEAGAPMMTAAPAFIGAAAMAIFAL